MVKGTAPDFIDLASFNCLLTSTKIVIELLDVLPSQAKQPVLGMRGVELLFGYQAPPAGHAEASDVLFTARTAVSAVQLMLTSSASPNSSLPCFAGVRLKSARPVR